MRKFINPERELNENIRVTVEAENTKELKDLKKCLLGDSYESFNQDFPEPTAECDGPECEPFKYEPDAFEQHDAGPNEYFDCQYQADPDAEDHDEFENYVDPFEKNPFDEEEPEESVDFNVDPDAEDQDEFENYTDSEESDETAEEDEDDALTPRAKALIAKTNKLAKKNHNKSKVMLDGKFEDADKFEEAYDSAAVDNLSGRFGRFLNDGNLEECANSDTALRTSVRVEEAYDDVLDDEDLKETEFDFEDDSNYYDTPEAQEAAEYWASVNDLTDDDYIEYPEETIYDEDGTEITEDVDAPEKTKKDLKSATLPFI